MIVVSSARGMLLSLCRGRLAAQVAEPRDDVTVCGKSEVESRKINTALDPHQQCEQGRANMPPIIRRAPLSERIKAYLNPYDLLLWIAEELHESALDEALRDWGMPIGVGANVVFACARWSSKHSNYDDDIFGELEGKSGWFHWFVSLATSLPLSHAPANLAVCPGLHDRLCPRNRIAVERLLYLYAHAQVPPL